MKKGSVNDGLVFHAGFPNASEDTRGHVALSLDSLIVQRRVSTFFWRLSEAIEEFGWKTGTVVVVDRSLVPRHGDKVVAIIDNDFVIRLFEKVDGRAHLKRPDGSREDTDQPALWGVVTWILSEERQRGAKK